jgi:hypothetical protein
MALRNTPSDVKKNWMPAPRQVAAARCRETTGLIQRYGGILAPLPGCPDAVWRLKMCRRRNLAAAKANNIQKAQASYNAVGKFCSGCHASHRDQMPDKTYRIKP